MSASEHVLLLSCPDRPGIVAAVTATLAAHDANIEDSQQFQDPDTGRFFMRIQFRDLVGSVDWVTQFGSVAEDYAMEWSVRPTAERIRTLILVSKFGHCLNDLLYRWQSGGLDIDIVGVASNHEDMRALVTAYGLPYHHIPVTKETKADAEAALLQLVDEHDVELVSTFTDRCYVLDFGKLIAAGPTAATLADPHVRAAYFGTTPEAS